MSKLPHRRSSISGPDVLSGHHRLEHRGELGPRGFVNGMLACGLPGIPVGRRRRRCDQCQQKHRPHTIARCRGPTSSNMKATSIAAQLLERRLRPPRTTYYAEDYYSTAFLAYDRWRLVQAGGRRE